MKIHENKKLERLVLTDIICDCCGKSCQTEDDEYEYMKLRAHWGFYTNKDGETWEAQICEDCVDKKLNFIKFKKT